MAMTSIYQSLRLLSLMLTLVAVASCSRPSAEAAKDVDLSIDQAGASGSSGDPLMDGFKTTLYPLVKENCSACHQKTVAPFFGSDDMASAMKVTMESHLADLKVPEESRLVKRLSVASHNCWSDCIANSQEMAKAIHAWANKAGDAVKGANGLSVQTTGIAANAADEKHINGENGTYVIEAEDAYIFSGPMEIIDDPVASKGKAITVKGTSDPNARSRAFYVFEIEQAGKYELWGRVKAPTNNNRQMQVVVDGLPIRTWTIDQAQGTIGWEKAQNLDAQNQLILPADLEPGTHTVEIFRQQTDFVLDMLALTSDTSFSGANEANVGDVKVLNYDISSLIGGKKARFEIEINTTETGSYTFRSPRIYTEKDSVEIKGIYVLVNGKFNPQYRTFANVSSIVAAPGGQKLSTASMVVLKENQDGSDQIAIGFEVLK